MVTNLRANGIRSRGAILERGVRLAERGGLPAATIGALADALGMSKSGVFAHFGSKDALDEAIVEAAAAHFSRAVLVPAAAAPAGVARAAALCEGYLDFLAQAGSEAGPRVTPGHPALALTEAGTAAGTRLRAWRGAWQAALTAAVADAIAQGEMAPTHDAGQVAFELDAVLEAAGRAWRDDPSDAVAARARRAVDRVLLA